MTETKEKTIPETGVEWGDFMRRVNALIEKNDALILKWAREDANMEVTRTEKAYVEATATARKAYVEATATARKAYVEATATAQKAYDEAEAPARKAYVEATATARKAYDEATARRDRYG